MPSLKQIRPQCKTPHELCILGHSYLVSIFQTNQIPMLSKTSNANIDFISFVSGLRLEAIKQELIFDGSLRITYGDQFQSALSNRSSSIFHKKANRYGNMVSFLVNLNIPG